MPKDPVSLEKYAAQCQRESDMVSEQSDNRFLRDLHQFRAYLAAKEATANDPENQG